MLVTQAVTSQSAFTALQLVQQLVAHPSHQLAGVFFYADGVTVAAAVDVPSDEENPHQVWCQFAQQAQLQLPVCITAAQRRGLCDADGQGLPAPFCASSLLELAALIERADKVVQL